MIKVALKGLAGRKVRALLTALAVVIGVSMVSGTFVLTDTMQKAFDGIFTESYDGTDAVVRGSRSSRAGRLHLRRRAGPRLAARPRSRRCRRSTRPPAPSRPTTPTRPTSSTATASRSPGRASASASTPPAASSPR